MSTLSTPTSELRWLHRGEFHTLQQKWRLWSTGRDAQTRFEWRDVPIVDESVTEAETTPVLPNSNELRKVSNMNMNWIKWSLVTLTCLMLLSGETVADGLYQQHLPVVGDDAPPCVIDWSLDATYANLQLILACHRIVSPMTFLCPPPGSAWEHFFNNSQCWLINYGTPASLTATALGPPTTTPGPPYP